MKDILFWLKSMALVCVHFHSQDAIGRAWSMPYNRKSLHIRHVHDIVRKLLSSGIIRIDNVKSKDNVSNPLTKSPKQRGS